MIVASWKEIQPKTLRLSWRKILPLEDESDDDNQEEASDPPVEQFWFYLQMLGKDLDKTEIGEWLETDKGTGAMNT